jgi:hypothetical protein
MLPTEACAIVNARPSPGRPLTRILASCPGRASELLPAIQDRLRVFVFSLRRPCGPPQDLLGSAHRPATAGGQSSQRQQEL